MVHVLRSLLWWHAVWVGGGDIGIGKVNEESVALFQRVIERMQELGGDGKEEGRMRGTEREVRIVKDIYRL